MILNYDTILLVMKNVVQPLQKFKKQTALELRKKGFSYSEIREKIKIPKSTLSFWLKSVKLTDYQTQKLKDKREKIAKANSAKRGLSIERQIEEIKNTSSKNIGQISKRELWLIGIILYWLKRNKDDLKNGVTFASSDPGILKLFLKWLKEVGGIKDQEIKFDIFLKKKKVVSENLLKEIIRYWSNAIGYPKERFLHHIYFQKSNTISKDNQNIDNDKIYGFLRVRVGSSSMLARQISGWIEGIVNIK